MRAARARVRIPNSSFVIPNSFMPTFAYAGRTRAGQSVTGERAADTMDAAVAALRRDQILLTRINPVRGRAAEKGGAARRGKTVPAKNPAAVTPHVPGVLDPGLPPAQCPRLRG